MKREGMNRPADQSSRDRFASELDRNFSVIASAGSGKTRAITDRIARIALSSHAREWLPRLAVVTFTNRAADEMQQRTRQKILESRVSLDVLAAFNRAFFGTIHSFCVKLLANHGHYLGLPARLDLITDDEDLWSEFVQRQTVVGSSLPPQTRAKLLRFVQVRRLMELGRRAGLDRAEVREPGDLPELNFARIYDFKPDKRSLEKITGIQADLREWERRLREELGFLPLPPCATSAKAFVSEWQAAFEPLRRWISDGSLCVAAEVARLYREFRLEKGALTYDDQIALAGALMSHPQAAKRIREKNYRVILDEAQDTDPHQFSLLLEITRPPEASGDWLATQSGHPRDGHFCMVGDFQQSIYGGRADLPRYRLIHDTLLAAGVADAVKFSVTFRLDHAQIEFVNTMFRDILDDTDGQVDFLELNPRPEALPGQVVALRLTAEKLAADGAEKIPERRKAEFEAAEIARWLKGTGLKSLRASSWREVAILCPRKNWFRPLKEALRREGFAVQIQSESELRGDSPAYAWFAALVTIMADPLQEYEIAGVLREVFGVSDHDLAEFAGGVGGRFQIARPGGGTGVVETRLDLLAKTRESIAGLPLFTAIERMLADTRLRERLHALPAGDYPGLDSELDALLAMAAAAEAGGKTLAQFAEALRANFETAREAQTAAQEAVQLITCQKAKGSEWQAVIVPFLARRVHTRGGNYPRIVKQTNTGGAVVALDGGDIGAELKAALDRAHRQEMERLLYVALTRAKHTLVLVDDRALFSNAKNAISPASQMKWLRCDGEEENRTSLAAQPSAAVECAATGACQKEDAARKSEDQKVRALPVSGPAGTEAAAGVASHFLRKLNPSGLAEAMRSPEVAEIDVIRELEPEFSPTKMDNPATRYGTWWHEFVEGIPWTSGAKAWDRTFNRCQAVSPDAERSAREWLLLRNHLEKNTGIGPRLAAGGAEAQAEVPLLWRIDGERCLEGIIDLVVFDPGAGKCLVLDWKTNRVTPGEIGHLREQYRPQLAAYWKVVTEATGLEVEAGLYSTPTGIFLMYEPEELTREWERLA